MAHTHEFDCIVCGAHLDTQDQLARHNKENHLRGAIGMEWPRGKGPQSDSSSRSERSDKSRSRSDSNLDDERRS